MIVLLVLLLIIQIGHSNGLYEWSAYGPQCSPPGVTHIVARPDGRLYVILSHCGVFKSDVVGEFWYHCNYPEYSLSPSAIYLYSIASSAGQSPILFIGGYNFIYKTTNGGATWFRADSGIVTPNVSIDIEKIVVHPFYNYAQLVYAGGYCSYPPPQEGGHIYRTTNGGINWEDISTSLPDFHSVNCIAVRRDNINLAFVSLAPAGIYKTTDMGNGWIQKSYLTPYDIKIAPHDTLLMFAGMDMLYRSTDGGNSWLPYALAGKNCYHIEFDTLNLGVVYVATDSGIYKSTNNGMDWFRTSFTEKTGQIVLLSLNKIFCNGGSKHTVYRSTDGGVNWEEKSSGLYGSDIRKIAVDCEDKNLIYAVTRNRAFRSFNGGITWEELINAPTSISAIETHPNLSNNLWAATDSGCIFYSQDGGTTWEQIGFVPSQITDIEICKNNPFQMYLSGWYIYYIQHGVIYHSSDGGYTWNLLTDIPSATCEIVKIDPIDDNILYIGGSGQCGIRKSTNGGLDWATLGLEGCGNCALEINPHNNLNIFVGASDIWFGNYYGLKRSTDGGFTWIQSSIINKRVWDIQADPVTGWIYAACGSDDEYESDTGIVYLSQNHGETWSELTYGFNPLLRFWAIKDIEVFSGGYRLYCGTGGMGVWEYTWPHAIHETTSNDFKKQLNTIVYPNLFRDKAEIKWQFKEGLIDNQIFTVKIKIYNESGNVVRVISVPYLSGSPHSVVWDGTDNFSRTLPSGVYFIQLEVGEFKKIEKVIRLK